MVAAFEILWKGIALGLLVSVPLGPLGIILINRTIKRGVFSGFFSGLGLGIADVILAIIAGLGFGVIITFLNQKRSILSIIAGLIIVAAGIKVFLSNPVKDLRNRERSEKSLWRDFYSAFMLAITNPYTIVIFVAFFSGIPIRNVRPERVPFFLIPGLFIGAMAWWTFLSYFVNRFKNRIRLRVIVRINQIAGILIIGIGIAVLLSLFSTMGPIG